METELLHQALTEFNATDRIAHGIQSGRPDTDAHHVGNHQHQRSRDTTFCRQTDFKGELSREIVHPTAQHQGKTVLYRGWFEYDLPRHGIGPCIGQGGRSYGEVACAGFYGATLKIELQGFLKVRFVRKRIFFPHEIGQGKVPVRSLPFGEIH